MVGLLFERPPSLRCSAASSLISQIARPRPPAWNKGKLTGSKPPLRPGHVRAKLQLGHRTRDLAMFNLAIDSKLRGCDQRKTGRPVRFEQTDLVAHAHGRYWHDAEDLGSAAAPAGIE